MQFATNVTIAHPSQDHMGGGAGTSPDLAHVGVYSSSSKKKMRMNAAAAAAAASPSSSTAQRTILIRFVPNVMLLEAAARNDVEEGESQFDNFAIFYS